MDIQSVLTSKIYFCIQLRISCPEIKWQSKKVEALAEKYILLDPLLFKIVSNPDKEATVLVIPEVCTDKIITLYHSSLFAGHQGIIKTYLTINDKFFIPNLIHYLHSYIKGCHICQLSHNEKPPARQVQTRINSNYTGGSCLSQIFWEHENQSGLLVIRLIYIKLYRKKETKFWKKKIWAKRESGLTAVWLKQDPPVDCYQGQSMDLKVMPRSHKWHKHTLCIMDEVTNYLITVPIYQSKAEEMGDALIDHIITKYCIPDCIIA